MRSFSDAGITVPGSVSDQKFSYVASFPTEAEEHVMVIRLLGEDPKGEIVKVPVTVKAKPKCQTCGRNNKAHSKFCVECGTALEII
jgi:tRNA(Ile2) C34 agmatinyltransferase TiaS